MRPIPKQHNINAPHQAVITVNIEIMERLDSGQVSGLPVKRLTKLYTVTGDNYTKCMNNIDKFLEKIND